MADSTTPLCTWQQFTSGAFSNLARNITDPQARTDLLLEATRLCEQEAERRLAPFTDVTETHPARRIDPNRYGSPADLPVNQATTSSSVFGAAAEVWHCWVSEYAPRYPEMWTYADVSVQPVRSDGTLLATQIQGPMPDTGQVWFNLGLLVPALSTIYVKTTYSGGYTTIPAGLVRAAKFMTAELVVRELQPTSSAHDPDLLHADAVAALAGYIRH